jgi:hypothetical protein
LTLTPTGLSVVADASGSTDNPNTPITSVFIDCGTGPQQVPAPWVMTCQYQSAGQITVTVAVFDSSHASATKSETITIG